jgi:hypothetical protein
MPGKLKRDTRQGGGKVPGGQCEDVQKEGDADGEDLTVMEKRCAAVFGDLPMNRICASSAGPVCAREGVVLAGRYLHTWHEHCLCDPCGDRQQRARHSETQCIQVSSRPSSINNVTEKKDAAEDEEGFTCEVKKGYEKDKGKEKDAAAFKMTESMRRRKIRLQAKKRKKEAAASQV